MRNMCIYNIMDIITKYLSPGHKDKKLTIERSNQVIKIKLEVAVVFVIIDKDSNISSVDICYENCTLKKYINNKYIKILRQELEQFKGLPVI